MTSVAQPLSMSPQLLVELATVEPKDDKAETVSMMSAAQSISSRDTGAQSSVEKMIVDDAPVRSDIMPERSPAHPAGSPAGAADTPSWSSARASRAILAAIMPLGYIVQGAHGRKARTDEGGSRDSREWALAS